MWDRGMASWRRARCAHPAWRVQFMLMLLLQGALHLQFVPRAVAETSRGRRVAESEFPWVTSSMPVSNDAWTTTMAAVPLSSPELGQFSLLAATTARPAYIAMPTTSDGGLMTSSTTIVIPEENDTSADSEREGPEKRDRCKKKSDAHGTWNGSIMLGGVYTLTCQNGYGVDGNSSFSMTCSDEGQWPSDPWCEDIDDCKKLKLSCGAAGVCVDHVGYAECLCEQNAIKKVAMGEYVCELPGDKNECGERNCGSHGVCINLDQYQSTFDTGSSPYRCSCRVGFADNGSTCAPKDCEELYDPLGTWSGETTFGGEYTLECQEGAFVWGGSEQAFTISCPEAGQWQRTLSTFPKCVSPSNEARDAAWGSFRFWTNVILSCCCICIAALACGLTLGMVGLSPVYLKLIDNEKADESADDEERQALHKQQTAARRLLPVVQDHHRLLVTLLLMNATANEALPIFLDELVTPLVAVLMSVTFVLMFGEITPSALFTGPMQLQIASFFVPLVKVLLYIMYPLAKPIAAALDSSLGHDEAELYTREGLRAVICLHSRRASREAQMQTESDYNQLEKEDDLEKDFGDDAPLSDLEADICCGVLELGCMRIRDCHPAYRTIDECTNYTMASGHDSAHSIFEEAVRNKSDVVLVFKSLKAVHWPDTVPVKEMIGIVRVADMLSASVASATPMTAFCKGMAIVVNADDEVLPAIEMLAQSAQANGIAAVWDRHYVDSPGELAGFLDASDALECLVELGNDASSPNDGQSPGTWSTSSIIRRRSSRRGDGLTPIREGQKASWASAASPGMRKSSLASPGRIAGQTPVSTSLEEQVREDWNAYSGAMKANVCMDEEERWVVLAMRAIEDGKDER